jgi:hypothetical protein
MQRVGKINVNNINTRLYDYIVKMELTNDELDTLIRVKKMMYSKPLVNRTETFKKLYDEIENLCMKHCEHHWIKDMFDIDPDRSIEVIYCIHCECTHP